MKDLRCSIDSCDMCMDPWCKESLLNRAFQIKKIKKRKEKKGEKGEKISSCFF